MYYKVMKKTITDQILKDHLNASHSPTQNHTRKLGQPSHTTRWQYQPGYKTMKTFLTLSLIAVHVNRFANAVDMFVSFPLQKQSNNIKPTDSNTSETHHVYGHGSK